MNITGYNLVAVMKNGQRYPIASVKLPELLTPRRGFELPVEVLMPAVQAQHTPHKVLHDPRPWLVFAGTDEQAENWQRTNHMPAERWRRVRSPADVADLIIDEWQLFFVGTWIRDPAVREAATATLLSIQLKRSSK